MDLELTGKSVLITGGSRGIGRACAEIFAMEGCHLHLAARGEEDLLVTKNTLSSRYKGEVHVHAVDLSQSGDIEKLVDACVDIDVLINNAGAIPRGDLWDIEDETWKQAWELKVFGYIRLCRRYYPRMKERGRGVIINIIGAAGERPMVNYISGGMANASLMAFTKALGAHGMMTGVRVVGVNPGLIKTERLVKQLKIAAEKRFNNADRWPELMPTQPPPGDPQDVAYVVGFLASSKARYITGAIVTVDGGITKL